MAPSNLHNPDHQLGTSRIRQLLYYCPDIVAIVYHGNPINPASIDIKRTDINTWKNMNDDPSHKNGMIANRRRM